MLIESVQRDRNIIHPTVVSLLRTRAEQQPDRVIYTFVSDSGGAEEVTYSELDRRACAIACMLRNQRLRDPVAMLLYPSGIDYIAAFFGCLYAAAIAVPAGPPDPLRVDRSRSRLVAVARDARPSVVLTTAAVGASLPLLFRPSPELSGLPVLVTDDVPAESSQACEPAPADAATVALLQYTSGSSSAPKGVVLTHHNLLTNSALIYRLFGHSAESRGVTWLPLYHDMGLIGGVLQPLYGGFPVTLMSPADFLRRPLRWLHEISRTRATTSGGPNFAYELCVRKTTAEERSQLDLSNWRVAFNGSEPVRAETMENFARAFRSAGFRREAFRPCYGLAEATLIVTGSLPWSHRTTRSFDPAALRADAAVPATAGGRSRRLVSCGAVPPGRHVVIVNPVTRAECPAGQVGEIWVSGSSVARSYWHRPEQARAVFQARLAGTGEGPFLRSGDLGFVLDGQLFVAGRLKDLIIIRGRNHYPQDIELTAERSSPVLRRGCAAAFTVADGEHEQLVIAPEVSRGAPDTDLGELADAIRAAVAAEHEIQVHTVVLLPRGGIPKTSSGKIQRGLCAAMFADGRLAELGRSTITRPAGAGTARLDGQLRLDRPSLLSAPAGERRRLLRDYLCGLVASACGINGDKVVVDAPLLTLGVDSYAVINIQQSIQADLAAHLTATDLAHAASLADLADRLDEQIKDEQVKTESVPPPAAVPSAAPSADEAATDKNATDKNATDKNFVRVYSWVSGSRVPVRGVQVHDRPADPGGSRPGGRPRWAS